MMNVKHRIDPNILNEDTYLVDDAKIDELVQAVKTNLILKAVWAAFIVVMIAFWSYVAVSMANKPRETTPYTILYKDVTPELIEKCKRDSGCMDIMTIDVLGAR